MTFRVGMKVVCVDDGPSVFFGRPCNAIKGHIYTVTSVWYCEVWDHPCILVSEIQPEGGYGFSAYRFRPVVSHKTDISIFTQMLNPSKVDA